MYDVYCEAVGGKAFNGDDLPKAGEFFNDESKKKQATAWLKAAEHATIFMGGFKEEEFSETAVENGQCEQNKKSPSLENDRRPNTTAYEDMNIRNKIKK